MCSSLGTLMGGAMTDEKFDEIVEGALDSIPDRFWDDLENVIFTVADEPDEEQLDSVEDWNSVCLGDELLGLYDGTPLTERDSYYGTGDLPDVITVFKGPHERCFPNEDELAEEVRKTIVHEIGHYFGNDEETLSEMGY